MTAQTAKSDVSRDVLGTAAAHATRRVPVAAPGESVDALLARLRGNTYDSASVVAVCDGDRLVGLASLERLLASDRGATVDDVMDRQPPTVASDMKQERVAWAAVQHGEPGIAVTGPGGEFHGLIPPQRLLSVLLDEHDDDMARLGGFLRSARKARAASTETVGRRLLRRLPWLVIGMLAALAAAAIVGSFESQLEKELLIAFFLPGVVYIADAVGTQSETLAIRGLSVGVGIRRILFRETVTGLLVGVLLSVTVGAAIVLLWKAPAVALAVAVAVFAASSVATLIAMGLPWLLDKMSLDPAYGSGPLATVVQDLVSILIYFWAAVVIVT
ncbi:MAG: magnesium transporter [Micromonosporaceae bacterium]